MNIKIKPTKVTCKIDAQRIYPKLEDLEITPSNEEQNYSGSFGNVKVKAIEAGNLEVTPTLKEQNFDGLYDKVNVKAIDGEELNVTPSTEPQTFNGIYETVNVKAIEGEVLEVTPNLENQTFNGIYTGVKVESAKGEDLNITPSAIEQNFIGLYSKVHVDPITGKTIRITPSTEEQEFNGVFTKVIVEAGDVETDSDIPVQDGIMLWLEPSDKSVETSSGTVWTDFVTKKNMLVKNATVSGSYAIRFNGTNTEFDTGIHQSELLGGYTLIFRFFPTEWGNNRGVYGLHSATPTGLAGLQYVNGVIGVSHAGGPQKVSLTENDLPVNKWSTIIIVSDGNNNCIVYINGKVAGTSNNHGILVPYGNLIIGKGYDSINRFFKGSMSHCILYNRPLSEEEAMIINEYANSTVMTMRGVDPLELELMGLNEEIEESEE